MNKLFSALNDLKTNIFGGQSYVGANAPGSNTPILRKSAIELADRSPTSRLDNDPLHFSSVSYPHDLTSDGTNGHYMLFYINVQNKTKFNYKAPGNVDVGGKTVRTYIQDTPIGPVEQGFGYYEAGQEVISSGATNQVSYQDDLSIRRGRDYDTSDLISLSRDNKRRKDGSLVAGNMSNAIAGVTGIAPTSRITDSIAIYLPANVTDSYTNEYNATETGILGYIASSGGKITEAYRNNDFTTAAEALLGTGGGVLEEMAKNLGSSVVEMLTQSEGGYEMLNKVFGRSTNPYLEVLYGGPQLRTFSYNFKFAPKNKIERDNVQKIIQMFRFHSAPEMRNDHNMFLGLPSEFDIHYMYQGADGKASENAYFPKIATCVLQSVNTNFTPNGVFTHEDGSPVITTMDLQFLETEMITKDHINEGF